MESLLAVFLSLVGIAFIGSLLTKYGILKESFNVFAKTFTIYIVALVILIYGVAMMLNWKATRDRFEGFQGFQGSESILVQWKEFAEKQKLKRLCEMYELLEENTYKDVKRKNKTMTEDQAREEAKKLVSQDIPAGPVSCSRLRSLDTAKDLDSFYQIVSKVPDEFLVQARQTAVWTRIRLEKARADLQKALSPDSIQDSLKEVKAQTKEGFLDICTPEVAEEKRKFVREKKIKDSQRLCLLPEEVSPERYETLIQNKLVVLWERLETMGNTYKGPQPIPSSETEQREKLSKLTIAQLVGDSEADFKQIQTWMKKAEEGTLAEDITLPSDTF